MLGQTHIFSNTSGPRRYKCPFCHLDGAYVHCMSFAGHLSYQIKGMNLLFSGTSSIDLSAIFSTRNCRRHHKQVHLWTTTKTVVYCGFFLSPQANKPPDQPFFFWLISKFTSICNSAAPLQKKNKVHCNL